MAEASLLSKARRGELLPFYLVVGEESFLSREAVSVLKAAATEGGIPGLNEDQLLAQETTVEHVLSAAKTLPMMAKRRLVCVRGIERWDAKDEKKKGVSALDRLLDYAQNPAETTVLLAVGGKLDKRRRLFTAAKKQGFLIACDPLPPARLPSWIAARASELGAKLAPGAAEMIAEFAGPSLSQLSDALERLSLYVGSSGTIDEEAVAMSLVRLKPTTVWELVGAVARRDRGQAIKALAEVYDPQDRGLRLVGVLAWQTRQLLKFEAAMRAGLGPQEACKAAGAPPFKARDLSQQVRSIPRQQLESWLPVLSGVDRALKGGSKRPPKAILEHALFELCRQ